MFFYYLVKTQNMFISLLIRQLRICEVKNIMTKIPSKGRLR